MEGTKPSSSTNITMTASDGTEVYSSSDASRAPTRRMEETVATAAPINEEEDDLNIPVSIGTTCKHMGCGVAFVSDELNRKGDGEGTVCTYHPSPVSPSFVPFAMIST